MQNALDESTTRRAKAMRKGPIVVDSMGMSVLHQGDNLMVDKSEELRVIDLPSR